MAISKKPTRSHGAGGSGKPPAKKPPTNRTVAERGDTEARTKARHDKEKNETSEVDTGATFLSTERPPQIQQRGKAKKVIESESEHDSSDEEEEAMSLHDGEEEPSFPGATAVWETKFVSKSARNKWKQIKTKQINPMLFERPLNFGATKSSYPDILRVIEQNGWTRFAQGPKGEGNLTLVRELYANWDLDRGNDIVWVRGTQVDISASTINKYYRIPAQSDSEYWRREQRPNVNHTLEVLCGGSGPADWQATDGLAKTYMNKEARIWLNWVCNRFMLATHKSVVIWEQVFLVYALKTGIVGAILRSQMAKTRKNIQWTLYFVHTLTALLAKYKLTEKEDELCGSTESAVHNICSVQDPSDTTIKKMPLDMYGTLESIHTLRSRGDAKLSALSATDGTATKEPIEVREVAVGNAAPTREGEMIAVVGTTGVTLEDPSALRIEVCYRFPPQPET
ncbi:hypothetical protein A4A49_35543 [Nicotiana attenuata]|uniref:Putative plant transposon protein domain-containing protein n=1 Tax=Nicotiana attenuata TaxID=49451 RepID=A0A314KNJ9_NICAT|nr:hypothetical protein A4A49_35543 [Nicotiana attenuata]